MQSAARPPYPARLELSWLSGEPATSTVTYGVVSLGLVIPIYSTVPWILVNLIAPSASQTTPFASTSTKHYLHTYDYALKPQEQHQSTFLPCRLGPNPLFQNPIPKLRRENSI